MNEELKSKFEAILIDLQVKNNISPDWLDKLGDLKQFVLDAQLAAYDLAKADEWVSVSIDTYPPNGTRVVGFQTEDGGELFNYVDLTCNNKMFFDIDNNYQGDITHFKIVGNPFNPQPNK